MSDDTQDAGVDKVAHPLREALQEGARALTAEAKLLAKARRRLHYIALFFWAAIIANLSSCAFVLIQALTK